jgi:hypothetical protein
MTKRDEKKLAGPRVKGTWLVDWAKIINQQLKNDPSKKEEYHKYLKEEDWNELTHLIVPSVAYPYDFFRRLGRAVFHVAANSNLNATRIFGRQLMKNLLQTYKNMLVANDPKASAKKLVDYHSLCFINVISRTKVLGEGEKSITILLTLTEEDKKFADAATAFAWQLGGNFEELITQAGAKNVHLDISKTPDNNYEYALTWE